MPKTRHVFVWFVLLAIMMLGCTSQEQPQEQAEKIDLFNGHDFTGWIKFIPDDAIDVDKVWMVKEGVIHCVGTPTGYIRTVDSGSRHRATAGSCFTARSRIRSGPTAWKRNSKQRMPAIL